MSASACALLLALTVTACGDDGVELPMAGDTEAVATYVDKNVGCQDTDFYTSSDLAEIRAEFSDAIDGGGDCDVDDDTDIDFLHVTDMTEFQKDLAASDESDDNGLMIGMNFVLDVDRDEHARTLLDAGLLYIDCEPGLEIPDTYTRVEAEAGCVLTNYERE
ncbi:hypothetical protein [Streptomyces neyagawaensis]|uniref:hypothetical protein n=1 Tax=Streptomyces neyagawaensis TaxID=42238 RepID=UPI0006E1F24A|nr:hypothetical protein [Streptomyces neyagawaensis]MCL6736184.1 hypothetical protein [Streptomyces neyagawaensis]MDE1684144.1 hypothetical protein [Streptomyces neyagawaensis]